MAFDPPTIAQAIEVVVRHRPDLSQNEIAQAIFGNAGYPQRVNQDLGWLENAGYITRDNSSGVARYRVARPGP
jgi:predicted transcriptional regulator